VELVAQATRRIGEQTQRWLAATLAGACLLIAAAAAADPDRLLKGHRRHTVDASTAEVLEVITNKATSVRASVLLGTWNHLSPWLVEWSCLQRGPAMGPGQVPRAPAGGTRRGNVLGWIAADPPELLMVLSAAPGSQPRVGFLAETGWLDPVRRQLTRDPRFHLVSRKGFPGSHYRLESFDPIRTDGKPVPR
jgi:hypothetical protein